MTNFNDNLAFPIYDHDDLGINYGKKFSTFKIWAPSAESARINVYNCDQDHQPAYQLKLNRKPLGIWAIKLDGDLKGKYYTLQIKFEGEWLSETPDIYAKAVGVNGKKAMIIDLKDTNPKGWERDKGPVLRSSTDAIIYELHIRDLGMHPSSGIQEKGKFLGLTEKNTFSSTNFPTGLAHIKALGITHIHLLPVFDYQSIDESVKLNNTFNWGYDPLNYNTPEGSYASNAEDGNTRILEFKEMVKAIHEEGLGIIMDVVYNHTGPTELSGFNLTVPGYFYRQNENGEFSNASACGNETASERPMVQNFILNSLKYWTKEYHIDGFRFDLMGIHDINTMNLISQRLTNLNSSLIIYGEGWTAGKSPLPKKFQAIKKNVSQLKNIAVFNDDLRDAIKGSWINHEDKGFVSGEPNLEDTIKFGIVGATFHSQINYEAINNIAEPWAGDPSQCINYVSCHDNHTLYDKLKIANPTATEDDIKKMHMLSNTIVLLSQGIPFLHAGVELLRSKQGDNNSYQSSDEINAINWDAKSQYISVFDYYCKLIDLRKNHPAFRLSSNLLIQKHLKFLKFMNPNVVGFQLSGKPSGESWNEITVIFNGNITDKDIVLPRGHYQKIISDYEINEDGLDYIYGGKIRVAASSALMVVKIK